MNIAFATGADWYPMIEDDALVAAELETRGHTVGSVVWNDAAVDWGSFHAVVIRTCWDYHRRVDEFESWLRTLRTPVVNPAPLLHWNLRKHYLRELGEAGVRIAETQWIPKGDARPLREMVRGECVLKPVVSASAEDTWRVNAASAEELEPRWRRLVAEKDAMIQRFVPEIATQGEWSLVFFGGEFSHAVLKRPGEADFRVQEEHGGESIARRAPEVLVERAAEILRLVRPAPVYARVDCVDTATGTMLMELELIEPYLFVGLEEGAAARFADAILGSLASRR